MNKQNLTLDDLFAELEGPDDATSEEHAARIEAARIRTEKRKLEEEAYEALMKAKDPEPFILGKDVIKIRTTSWCLDTCGRDTLHFTAVAKDEDFIYFWNIGKVEWHQSEEVGYGHPNPFFKLPISQDNSNWFEDREMIWSEEKEWFEICHILIKNAVLPETRHFDYLFDYVNS